jgi:hypothetical protein
MKVATRSFSYIDDDGVRDTIVAGRDRIADDHPLARAFPGNWREENLEDELKVRRDCIASMRERAARPAGRGALSEAGREELRQQDFWRATEALLERTARDRPTSAEQREQAFFDQALASLESMDTAELAEVNETATRDFGFDRGWSRRVSD